MARLTPAKLNLVLFAFLLGLALLARTAAPLWTVYADPQDYLYQSRLPLASKAFWMPEKTEGFYPRPFTVPLFYKFAGSDPETIIRVQKCMHALSALLFAGALLPSFRHRPARYLFLAGWYLLMGWWNVLGWASTLLSESLSTSLLFLWLASFLHLARKQTIPRILLHLTMTVMLSFTRDSWPYVLMVFYGLYLLVALWREKPLRNLCAGMLIFSGMLFVIQQHTAKIGQRYRLAVMNNIVFRVLPDPEYLAWFEQHGMPDAARLKEKYSLPASGSKDIYPLYDDPEFSRFSAWAADRGNLVYARFLLTHPKSLLLLKEPGSAKKRMLAYSFGYIGEPRGFSWGTRKIFPVRPERVLLLLAIFVYISWREKANTWILPVILSLVFAFNAWLLYLADSMEVERHEYFTMTMVQFLCVLILSLLADSNLALTLPDRLRRLGPQMRLF